MNFALFMLVVELVLEKLNKRLGGGNWKDAERCWKDYVKIGEPQAPLYWY